VRIFIVSFSLEEEKQNAKQYKKKKYIIIIIWRELYHFYCPMLYHGYYRSENTYCGLLYKIDLIIIILKKRKKKELLT
jgi:hypothetical protein